MTARSPGHDQTPIHSQISEVGKCTMNQSNESNNELLVVSRQKLHFSIWVELDGNRTLAE